jgi:hypothetical protein
LAMLHIFWKKLNPQVILFFATSLFFTYLSHRPQLDVGR